VPYTLAHPAAVIPLRRLNWFTSVGLMIGAMSPDFEHVIRLNVISVYSHTWFGIILFCLPAGLFVTYVCRRLWFPAFIFLGFRELKLSDRFLYRRDILSVVVGAVTHVVWDSFTHENRFGVDAFTFLKTNVQIVPHVEIPIWNLLQHLSSFVGLTVISYFLYMHLKNPLNSRRTTLHLSLISGIMICLSLALTILFWPDISMKKFIVLSANNGVILIGLSLTFIGYFSTHE
jgi:Domain of unknown function (DUF4184)